MPPQVPVASGQSCSRAAEMSAPHPEVSILIVSYNTRELTLAAIDSVVRETRARHEIIVVDNASTDGSAEAIAAHPAAPRLIALEQNIGFGRANNVAAQHARAEKLLLLNPDTVVLSHAIDNLLAFSRMHSEARIWGGRTLFADGRLNPSSCWHRITMWNAFCRVSGLAAALPNSAIFNTEAFGGWPRDTERQVDIVSGCFLLLPRSLWHELGGFDPVFYMYGEEADLCLRACRLGARPMVTPAATIIHIGGASETTRAAKMIKLLAAKITLADRHLPAWQRPMTRLLLRAWPLTRLIAFASASALSRSQRFAAPAAQWREIWERRREWQDGYPDATATPTIHSHLNAAST